MAVRSCAGVRGAGPGGRGAGLVADTSRGVRQARARRVTTRPATWQAELHRGGWAGISWPKKFGGRGGIADPDRDLRRGAGTFHVSNGPLMVSINMVGPTLMAHGTEQQQVDHLEKIISGQEIWCQLYSEPGAGSDLALAAHPRRPRWRRVGRQRPEGLELQRPRRRLGDPAGAYRRSTSPSTAGSRTSSSTCARPASTCARCARRAGRTTSTRSSSTTCASRWPTCSARSATAGTSPAPRSRTSAR